MKKLIILFLPFLLLTACVDSLEEYNVDEKKATVVPPATLFSSSLKELTDVLTTPSVNTNNFRLYVQQWSTTTYLDEPRYNLTARIIPQSMWQELYRDVISDLNEAKRLLNADAVTAAGTKNNQMAQIEITEIYAWSVLVNTFGNVPYSEALDANNPLPKYDDAKTIYDDLLTRLDAALALITPAGTGFTDGDLIYEGNTSVNGDMSNWLKFGNSLKLKMAMTIADVDPAKAKTLAAAAAPNVFTSNDDNAAFPYIASPPNYNPVSQNLNRLYSTRQDFVAASTFLNPMNTLNDPRRSSFFTDVDGKYIGGNYGFLNTYANFSHVGTKIIEPTLEGLLMDYSEVEFLLAEAVERQFITMGTAAEHYNKAVTASITYWGSTGAEAAAYLAQPGVAYATAAGDWKMKIGTQKWFALYNRGYESWVEWRRLDAPKLLPPTGGNAPAGLAIPVRIIYPINEQTLNPASREAAASAIGGDLATTKLWWDKF